LGREIIKQGVLGFIVFELDMQTVFDADFHFDGVVAVGGHAV
jgi:hypothetical protein